MRTYEQIADQSFRLILRIMVDCYWTKKKPTVDETLLIIQLCKEGLGEPPFHRAEPERKH